MKFFTNQKNSKKIIISLLIVMLFNFMSPTISSAATNGGVLFDVIADLLCTISDCIIGGLQDYFMGVRSISREPVPDSEYNEYVIAYSPGVIFSGKVASLKTNFINAESDDKETLEILDYEYIRKTTVNTSEAKTAADVGKMFEESLSGLYSDEDLVYTYWYADPDIADGEFTQCDYVWTWHHNEKQYIAIMIDAIMTKEDAIELGSTAGIASVGAALTILAANTVIIVLQRVRS